MNPNSLFQQIGMHVGQQVADLINVALTVEPAGWLSDRWGQLLQRYQVPAIAEDQRLREVKENKQTKGAPLSEVACCLDVLIRQVRSEALGARAQNELPAIQELDNALRHLFDQGIDYYRRLACERPRGMFGHAMATAQKHQYNHIKSSAYVLLCPTCGGPRLTVERFNCLYCGGAFGDKS